MNDWRTSVDAARWPRILIALNSDVSSRLLQPYKPGDELVCLVSTSTPILRLLNGALAGRSSTAGIGGCTENHYYDLTGDRSFAACQYDERVCLVSRSTPIARGLNGALAGRSSTAGIGGCTENYYYDLTRDRAFAANAVPNLGGNT